MLTYKYLFQAYDQSFKLLLDQMFSVVPLPMRNRKNTKLLFQPKKGQKGLNFESNYIRLEINALSRVSEEIQSAKSEILGEKNGTFQGKKEKKLDFLEKRF